MPAKQIALYTNGMSSQSAPLISVLLPVKNGGVYLRPAVESVLAQTHQNIELILIDDHSDDDAISQLPSDPRLQVHQNSGHGISPAMVLGFSLAQGEFIARMDGDDIALPERLAAQLAYLEQNPSVDICGTEVEIFTEQGPPQGGYARYQTWINSLHTPAEIADSIYIESPIPNPTVMFRRAAYQQLGGYHDPVWHEDYDLYLRAHQAGMQMGKPEGVLLRWRDHVARSTRNQSRYLNENLMACKAHYLAKQPLADRPAILCGTGPVAKVMHDALVAEGVTVEAFMDIDPSRIGQQKRGKPVLPYSALQANNRALYLGALGSNASRHLLHQQFLQSGLLAGRDYLFCA